MSYHCPNCLLGCVFKLSLHGIKSSLAVCLPASLTDLPSTILSLHLTLFPHSLTSDPLSCSPLLLPQLSSLSWTRRPLLGTNRRYRFLFSALGSFVVVCLSSSAPVALRGFHRLRFAGLGSRNEFIRLLKCHRNLKHLAECCTSKFGFESPQ